MSKKSKGINAERELVHKLWAAGWSACRVAGSGSSHYPSPDVIAGKGYRSLAIECKKTKKTKYLTKDEVKNLVEFAEIFGAEPWIGVRFREGWFFLKPQDLRDTGKGLAVSKDLAKQKGLGLDGFLGQTKDIV